MNFFLVFITLPFDNFRLHEKLIFDFFASRVNAIDPALRRSGRFDVEIEVTAPTEEERLQILEVGSIAL